MLHSPELRCDGSGNPVWLDSKILILTIAHGASHERVGKALEKALLAIQPDLQIKVVDALEYCAPWFRLYYNSYEIPLKYWPGLWRWIESIQHGSTSTGPCWLYRRGAQPLFRFIEAFNPGIVVATEVGVCELAAMIKRESGAEFYLVGAPNGVDVDRAWAQPETDLYPIAPGDVAAQLEDAGVPPAKIFSCGMPVDPAFAFLPDRALVRKRLQVNPDVLLLLVLFGGTGVGTLQRIVPELNKVQHALQVVFITGRNRRLEREVSHLARTHLRYRVLGWVENMHEWMAAADLLLTKPGASTLIEAIDSGLPLLAFDPLPGGELRTCDWIEK